MRAFDREAGDIRNRVVDGKKQTLLTERMAACLQFIRMIQVFTADSADPLRSLLGFLILRGTEHFKVFEETILCVHNISKPPSEHN